MRQSTRATAEIVSLNNTDVQKAYRRWAPFYDQTFGKIVEAGVQQTVRAPTASRAGFSKWAWAPAWRFRTMPHISA